MKNKHWVFFLYFVVIPFPKRIKHSIFTIRRQLNHIAFSLIIFNQKFFFAIGLPFKNKRELIEKYNWTSKSFDRTNKHFLEVTKFSFLV